MPVFWLYGWSYICNIIFQELELYKPELVNKPAILILNKIDTEGAEKLCDETVKKVKNMKGDCIICFFKTLMLCFQY